MKCLCGYERLKDWEAKDNKEVGDEDFIKIDCFGKPFETDGKTGNYYGDEYKNGYLYACPKCKMVQLNFDEW